MEVNLIAAIIVLFYLIRQLVNDKENGKLKEKIAWFIVTLFMTVYYSSFFLDCANLAFHYRRVIDTLSENLGSVERKVFFLIYIANILLSIILFFCGIGMLYRDKSAREIASQFIIYSIPIVTLSIYFHSKSKLEANVLEYSLIGLIISFLIFGSIRFILNKPFMINYFSKNIKG